MEPQTSTTLKQAKANSMVKRSVQGQEIEQNVMEEEWTNEDGENIFEEPFKKLQLSKIEGLFPNRAMNQSLVFESYSEKQMTPLDMTYSDTNTVNEFYDGTGSLVWLASIAFCHLVAQEKIPILYNSLRQQKEEQLRICELGCGCGLAGIALLLSSSSTTHNSMVVFTDNDSDALDLCLSNCELNDLSTNRYQHHLLSWGESSKREKGEESLREASFHIILATDVVYDISMIHPLLQTASRLLKVGGHILLSHVPRFCLPRDENDTKKTNPQHDLEKHILEQMNLVGLQLVEMIRPHQVLSSPEKSSDDFQVSLERLQDAHAVLFVARKQ